MPQVQGGFTERQTMQRRPEVNHVAAGSAVELETVEPVLAQIDAEAAITRLRPVQRARATPLRPAAFQCVHVPAVTQHALQRQRARRTRSLPRCDMTRRIGSRSVPSRSTPEANSIG